jgi:FADH2 O2-dependent halogenase
LEAYAKQTALELEFTAKLVGSLYATMDRFELFKQLSLLYFAAAHYSETAWRTGRADLADTFLLCGNAGFSRDLREICVAATRPSSSATADQLAEQIRAAIKPFDLLGLTDPSCGPWYPALEPDLPAAEKVDASRGQRVLTASEGIVDGATPPGWVRESSLARSLHSGKGSAQIKEP